MKAVAADRIVIGKRAVCELLRSMPERVEYLLCAGRLPEGELGRLIGEHKIRVEPIAFDELSQRAGSESHQGIAACIHERVFTSLPALIERAAARERMLVLALDGLEDPHNFGAVLRAAECFGVDAVVWSKNRGTSITPVVAKASAGATELLDLVPVSNLADCIRKLKAEGFWAAAAAIGENTVELPSFSAQPKTVLLLGAEGRGLSHLLLQESDFVVQIPMHGKIEALNVSQAAAVFLYALRACGERLKK